ncbi:MAG: hypothetical protein AVDCRST_MAG64-1156, partial [uncultured Phycisphaerae bacterium]
MKDEGGRLREDGVIARPFILHPSAFILRFTMISLTRLNGQGFVINAEKIRTVESTPDTVVCTDGGERVMVRET